MVRHQGSYIEGRKSLPRPRRIQSPNRNSVAVKMVNGQGGECTGGPLAMTVGALKRPRRTVARILTLSHAAWYGTLGPVCFRLDDCVPRNTSRRKGTVIRP